MKKIKLLCFLALLFSVISCSKDENPAGFADKVVGTYLGTMYRGAAPLSCTSQIIKTTAAKVKLIIIIGGSSFTFGEIAVMNAANNTYILSYSDQSGNLDGKVDGNTLTYSISSGVLNSVFTGTRY